MPPSDATQAHEVDAAVETAETQAPRLVNSHIAIGHGPVEIVDL